MKIIGDSDLWCEKYRPQNFEDYIASSSVKKLLANIEKTREINNMILFSRSPGTGKTSLAFAIAKELGSDCLKINGSAETSIDTIRYKVQQFATTYSLMGGKKLIIIDEAERISANGMDALKVIQEQTESNARYVLCTNNVQKIIPPLLSRCQLISFEHDDADRKDLMLQYFKRVQFILNNESVPFEKEVVAEFVKKTYPDFRKIINELQKFYKMNGAITKEIFSQMDESHVGNLIVEMKNKKFNNMRALAAQIDGNQFYAEFYKVVNEHLQPQCIPDVILILGRYAYQHSSTIDHEINLICAIIEIAQVAVWK